jgi:broad specificity phosphatase PhoE
MKGTLVSHAWHFLLSLLVGTNLFAGESSLIVVRHGEATSNIEKVYNSDPENANYKSANLTKAGHQTVLETAKRLLSEGFSNDTISAVFVSPLPRCIQTADILAQQGLFSSDKIHIDKRLIEQRAGDLEGKPQFATWEPSFAKKYNAESPEQVKNRVQDFYSDILRRYPQGNILVVTHALPGLDLIQIASHQQVKLNPGEAYVTPLESRNQ